MLAHSLTQIRQEKLARLKALGIQPYPHFYRRSHTIEQAISLFLAQKNSGPISIAGRIMAQRDMGKIKFWDIKDGSGKLQLCFRQDLLGESWELLKELDTGDFLGAEGELFRTLSGEITLLVSRFTPLAKALQPLPEKWHGLQETEKRYRQRYLDLIVNPKAKETFERRSRIIAAIRRFLSERGFIEVETPIFHHTPSGALAQPFTTYHNALDETLYLRIATELHLKRLIIGGMEKVFEIGRVFRNEGISTKHNPEFTTLESYEAYADYHTVMEMLEQMVAFVSQEVIGSTQITFNGNHINLSPPWRRITLREAILERCGIDIEVLTDFPTLKSEVQKRGLWRMDWQTKSWGKVIEKLVDVYVEPTLLQPTFILDYPVEISPLAKRKADNDRLVERFEAFIGGMEIANAFTELNDPQEQRERFLQQLKLKELGEEAEAVDEDFLKALEYGMPPTGGLGVGIDRLVMLLTDQPSIREVILFPQLRSK